MFHAHSRNAYIRGLHEYYCRAQPIEKAAETAGMNPTVLWRACTGWSSTKGTDGRIGRAVFLSWVKGLRDKDGAACCGAHVIEGRRKPPVVGEENAKLKELETVEEQLRLLTRKLEKTRAALGLGALLAAEGPEPKAASDPEDSMRTLLDRAAP